MRKPLFLIFLLLSALFLCACTNLNERPSPSISFPKISTTENRMTAEVETTEKIEETTPPIETKPAYVYENAIKDYLLPLDDYSWERDGDVEFIMIHFTSAIVAHRDDPFNIQHIRDTFLDYKISIHYIIERDGTIRCYMPENRAAWHAGYGEWNNDPKYTNDINPYSIGIELLAIGSESDMSTYLTSEEYATIDDTWKGFTDEQYKALNLLIDDLCERYDISKDRQHIIGHEEFSPSKNDPGELFDWERVLTKDD